MDGNEARVWVGHSKEAVISLKCNEKPLEGFQVSKKRLAFRGGPEAALAHLCSIWGPPQGCPGAMLWEDDLYTDNISVGGSIASTAMFG